MVPVLPSSGVCCPWGPSSEESRGSVKISFIACYFLMKAHQLQQKQQLTVLSEKAKREVQESQRFLNDLLQDNLKVN